MFTSLVKMPILQVINSQFINNTFLTQRKHSSFFSEVKSLDCVWTLRREKTPYNLKQPKHKGNNLWVCVSACGTLKVTDGNTHCSHHSPNHSKRRVVKLNRGLTPQPGFLLKPKQAIYVCWILQTVLLFEKWQIKGLFVLKNFSNSLTSQTNPDWWSEAFLTLRLAWRNHMAPRSHCQRQEHRGGTTRPQHLVKFNSALLPRNPFFPFWFWHYVYIQCKAAVC